MSYAVSSQQRGAILILMVFALVVLVGFIGFVVDVGRMYVIKSEVQSITDACALAAAAELQGDKDQLLRAEKSGIAVGNRNKVNFQNANATLAEENISFNTTLNGDYLPSAEIATADVPSMRYVRCEWRKDSISMYFMRVLGFVDQSVAAAANATLAQSQTTCAIPIALCSASISGATYGDWLTAGLKPGEGLTGDFLWIDFSPTAGGNREIKDILTGQGLCGLPATGTIVGQPGGQNGAVAAWNTRFGIYTAAYDPASAPPDRSGFTYTSTTWTGASGTAFKDLTEVARLTNKPYQGDLVTGLKTHGAISGSTVLQTGGNRRVIALPVIDCGLLAGGGHTAPVNSWACALMLQPLEKNAGTTSYLEYLGSATEMGSPCASTGIPGGAGPKVPALVK